MGRPTRWVQTSTSPSHPQLNTSKDYTPYTILDTIHHTRPYTPYYLHVLQPDVCVPLVVYTGTAVRGILYSRNRPIYYTFSKYSIMACYNFRTSVPLCIPSKVFHCTFFHWGSMEGSTRFHCVHLCLLNKHTGRQICNIADFFFPLFPSGHDLLVVIIGYNRGLALFAESLHVYSWTIFYYLRMAWSEKVLMTI